LILICLSGLVVLYGTLVLTLFAFGRRSEARALAGFVPDCLILFKRLLADSRIPPRSGRFRRGKTLEQHLGHSHGLIDPSIKRSRAGVRAVLLSLAVLGITALAQTLIFTLTGSIALLADLIHPEDVDRVGVLVAAGLLGWAGNRIAAQIRTAAGHSLNSPALIADGNHARADAYVSLAVVASALAVSLGLQVADPLIGLGITLVILKITWDSWQTVRGGHNTH
jgi:Co/Zn/Cd efflux system component